MSATARGCVIGAVLLGCVLGWSASAVAQDGPAPAQAAPHDWRFGLSAGFGGTVYDSEVVAQLRAVRHSPQVTYDLAVGGEGWVTRGLGFGASLWWHQLPLDGPGGESVVHTVALLPHVVVAGRSSPSRGGLEAGLELAAGPALVAWSLNGETTDAVGVVTRVALRLGQGLDAGFVWSVRPWLGTTWGADLGASNLSARALSVGLSSHVGWGGP